MATKKDKPNFELVDDIAPVIVGDPAAADDLAIDQEHLEEYVSSGSEGEAGAVECKRPPRGIFFTVRAENSTPWRDRAFYWFLEIADRDPYIITPAIAKQKAEEEDTIRPVLITRYVTMAGEEALWALKLDLDGRSNPYNTSARNILSFADGSGKPENRDGREWWEGPKWVRIMSASKGGGKNKHYRYQISRKTLVETPPKFSARTFKELFGLCFDKERIISSLNHEVWDILKHGSTR